MFGHGLNPAVKEKALLLVEHPLRVNQDLFTGLVEILCLTSQLSHLGHCGNAHEKIVKPDRIRLRPVARQSSILQTEFSGHDVGDVTVD